VVHEPTGVVLNCPFCGRPESDRVTIDGTSFIVFGCMFTPRVDPSLSDEALTLRLAEEYGRQGEAYFRGICDRLHLVVARPPAATGDAAPP
jgi:hypothetical protein